MAEPKVLLNDFKRQWQEIGEEVVGAVEKVGASGWYILGSSVSSFERSLAKMVDCRYGIGCASGLDAIEIGLRVLGIKKGDRVLTTPLSAFATTLAIVRAGGRPVFVDTDECGLIDLDLCEEAFAGSSDIRFFVPVHLYGHSLDLVRLGKLKRRYGLRVVEDCAQSILARWDGRFTGSTGQVGATSFYPTKNLGVFGDGGAVLTNDSELYADCVSVRNYGQTSQYVHDVLGLNSRLDEIHAAVLKDVLLPRLADWTERRRAIAQAYREAVHNPRIRIPAPPASSDSCYHLFPVMVSSERRGAFQAYLEAAGVQNAIHYPHLITDQKALLRSDKLEVVGEMRCARRVADEEVSLPIHPFLNDAEVARVIDNVNSWQG